MKKPKKPQKKAPFFHKAPYKPQTTAQQVHQHQLAMAKLAKFKPLTAKQQIHKHRVAVHKANVAAAKKQKWSPDGAVALCAARAVAESLRLATGRVLSDADVLTMYWSTATDPDEGQTILDALSAARCTGLPPPAPLALNTYSRSPSLAGLSQSRNSAFILALGWPQPHAVAVDPSGLWWSWGELHEPWTDDITEAWAVSWLP